MRFKEILESPIQNYDTSGLDGTGFFSGNPKDAALVKSQKHIKRVKKAFEKTPFNFDLYFVDTKPKGNTRIFQYQNAMTNAGVYDEPQFGIQPKPNTISVIYLSNHSDDPMPLTPWILAHRFMHGIEDSRKASEASTLFYKLDLYIEKNRITPEIFTFKSAKTGSLDPGELPAELMSQYLLQGTIRVNQKNLSGLVEELNNFIKAILKSCVGKIVVTA